MRQIHEKQTTESQCCFQAKVALAAIKDKTIAELFSAYAVHPNQITQWKKQLLDSLPDVFFRRRNHERRGQEALTSELYQQIGPLKVEPDWVKKNPVRFRIWDLWRARHIWD